MQVAAALAQHEQEALRGIQNGYLGRRQLELSDDTPRQEVRELARRVVDPVSLYVPSSGLGLASFASRQLKPGLHGLDSVTRRTTDRGGE